MNANFEWVNITMNANFETEQTNVNWLAHDSTTALLLAVCYGRTECSQMLLKHGADVNQGDHMNTTPLLRGIHVNTFQ